MRSLLTVFVLTIVSMACCSPVEAADDAVPVKLPSDGQFTKVAAGSDDGTAPATEPCDNGCVAPEPDNCATEARQRRSYLGSLSCRPCPCTYGGVEALLLEQVPQIKKQPIVVDANTGATYLSTTDVDAGFAPGLRATFGRRLGDCLAVEFTYVNLTQSGAALTQKTDPASYPIFPGNLAGNVFVDPDAVVADYSTCVNSFELNFPCCCGCCCSESGSDEAGCSETSCGPVRCRSLEWFAGLRYLDITNHLNLTAQRNENGGVEQGTYDIQTGNHLFGAQLGARLRRTTNRFGWEVTGKAGIFNNDATQTQSVIDFPNFPLRPTTSAFAATTAFVGEINLSGIFRLTDIWSVKAGYNVLWIEDLALAPDQLDFNFAATPSGNQLHTGGGLFYHGANVGLEARW